GAPKWFSSVKFLIFADSNELIEVVKATWSTNHSLMSIIEGLQQGSIHSSKYIWSANELRRKGKFVVGNDEVVTLRLIARFHGTAADGHFGVLATLKRICAYFYWKVLRKW
ncbi:reverse transcriptase, partial [Tanacetum coccineum]